MGQAAVVGGGGVRLALHETGPAEAPPLVLLHGWAQSAAAWRPVTAGSLARRYRIIAPDLRGHGASEVPDDGYQDSWRWAADVAAVLARAGEPAVLVGWSYGGLVIADYLREHGSQALAGIVLVGAITEIGRGRPGGKVGPVMRQALPDALAENADRAIPALAGFVAGMAGQPLPGSLAQRLLGAALLVPPAVRAALFARDVESAGTLAAVDVPALVLHGAVDAVVDPRAGEYAAGKLPDVTAEYWDGVGHLPFAERPDRFAAAVGSFAGGCFASVRGDQW